MAEEGKPLKLKAACLQCRGDWAWLKGSFNLCGWSGEGKTGRICYKCAADKQSMPFTDPSLTAAWRTTLISDAGYIGGAAFVGSEVSSLFSIPGFKLSYIGIDWMHTVDLGIAQYAIGNVLWELFKHTGGLVTRPGQSLASLLTMIRLASKNIGQTSRPLNSLTLGMIKVEIAKPLVTLTPEHQCHYIYIYTYIYVYMYTHIHMYIYIYI